MASAGEAVGHVVLQTLSDLKAIRTALAPEEPAASSGDPARAALALDAALHAAESALRQQAEALADALLRDDAARPATPRYGSPRSGGAPPQAATRKHQVGGGGRLGTMGGRATHGREDTSAVVSHALRRILMHPSAEDSRRLLHERYGVPLPPHPTARAPGVALNFRPQPSGPAVRTSKTTAPASVPNHALRHDPGHAPPPLDATMAERGALDLAQRGLLPYGGTAIEDFLKAAEADGELFRTRRAAIHNGTVGAAAAAAATRGWDEVAGQHGQKWSFPLTNVKFDTSAAVAPAGDAAAAAAAPVGTQPPRRLLATPPVERWAWPEAPPSLDEAKPPQPGPESEPVAAAPAPEAAFNKLMDKHSLHEFLIRRGKVLSSTPEFESFRRAHAPMWADHIEPLVMRLAGVCFEAAVPLAVVDGKALADLATYVAHQHAEGLMRQVSLDDLLACVHNATQVRALVSTSAKSDELMAEADARERAAARIQARHRGGKARSFYAELKMKDAAALKVQARWRMFMLQRRIKEAMAAARDERARRFVELQEELHATWDDLMGKDVRRVEVHVASYSTAVSRNFEDGDLRAKENAQIGRLARCTDPNVEVVYVSTCDLGAVEEYMSSLLALGSEDELLTTGSATLSLPEVGAQVRHRVVVPENRNRMPAHSSLASCLLSSPMAIKRIKSFIGSKPAVLVPLHAGDDDVYLSTMLGIPMLGAHPLAAQVLHQKSVARQLFTNAGAMTAPGVTLAPLERGEWHPSNATGAASSTEAGAAVGGGDSAADNAAPPPVPASATSERAQLSRVLADLIIKHPYTPRWLLKQDECLSGNGIAYVDVTKLPDQAQAVVVALQNHSAASATEEELVSRAFDVLVPLIKGGLERATTVVSARQDGTLAFLSRLARTGGVVEAVPVDVLGSPVANVFVHPGSGRVDVLSTCEQMFSPSYRPVGYAYPQMVIPSASLAEAACAIAAAAYNAGAVGHMSVEFVVLRDPADEPSRVQLWAVDVKCHMSTSHAQFELLDHVCRGEVDAETGEYTVVEQNEYTEDGSAVVSRNLVATDVAFNPRLRGGNLERHFNNCRLNGIVFEPASQVGMLYVLPDAFSSGFASVLTCGRGVGDALRLAVRALEALEDEAGRDVGDAASVVAGGGGETAPPNTFANLLATLRFLGSRVE